MGDGGTPVGNVMIFAKYTMKNESASGGQQMAVGPILSDANGHFLIPKFYKKNWYLEHLYMGDCGGELLFIHPTLGAHSVLICSEDYPTDLPFKELKVVQRGIDEKWTKEKIRYSYTAIDGLPIELRATAWAHVNSAMR